MYNRDEISNDKAGGNKYPPRDEMGGGNVPYTPPPTTTPTPSSGGNSLYLTDEQIEMYFSSDMTSREISDKANELGVILRESDVIKIEALASTSDMIDNQVEALLGVKPPTAGVTVVGNASSWDYDVAWSDNVAENVDEIGGNNEKPTTGVFDDESDIDDGFTNKVPTKETGLVVVPQGGEASDLLEDLNIYTTQTETQTETGKEEEKPKSFSSRTIATIAIVGIIIALVVKRK